MKRIVVVLVLAVVAGCAGMDRPRTANVDDGMGSSYYGPGRFGGSTE
ncbi:hypothetical protein [Noviherbaspirillum saxi]|nr:hypothetical protein [Noviherbaspirillum saxi]